MDPTHRKIELHAPSDLTSLVANASRVAREKIDLHLPPSAAPAGEDALRRRVEELVDAYIRNTFAGVRRNVTVNGIDADEVPALAEGGLRVGNGEDEFEPFDHALASTVQALAGTLESLTLQLADLRRTGPAQAARAFEHAFTQQDAELTETEAFSGNEKEEALIDHELRSAQKRLVADADFQRWDEVRATWEKGTEGLVGLKGGLTETVARVERAKAVLAELESRRR